MATKKTEETAQVQEAVQQPSNEEIMAKLSEVIALNEQLKTENEQLKADSTADAAASDENTAAIERMNEKVPVTLFKDNGKYKDDLVVQLAGVAYQIKRGVTVMVPRAVYDIIRRSQLQDQRTANMLDTLQEEYAKKNASNL